MYESTYILLRNLEEKNEQAMKQLFENYYISLVLFSDYFTNNIEFSKKTVQDIFQGLWRCNDMFTAIEFLEEYLYNEIKSNCIRYIKQEKKKDKNYPVIDKLNDLELSFMDKVLEEEVYRNLYLTKTKSRSDSQLSTTDTSIETTEKDSVFKLARLISLYILDDSPNNKHQLVKNWEEASLYTSELLRSFKNEENLNEKINCYSSINWLEDYNKFMASRSNKRLNIQSFIKNIFSFLRIKK